MRCRNCGSRKFSTIPVDGHDVCVNQRECVARQDEFDGQLAASMFRESQKSRESHKSLVARTSGIRPHNTPPPPFVGPECFGGSDFPPRDEPDEKSDRYYFDDEGVEYKEPTDAQSTVFTTPVVYRSDLAWCDDCCAARESNHVCWGTMVRR